MRLSLDPLRWLFIILAVALVWVAEAFNTVMEMVIDHVSREYSETAKQAKDVAASAVLIGAIILVPLILEKILG